MAFTTMAIIALSAYAASKTAADIIAKKRAAAAAEQAAKDAAATAAPAPQAPAAPVSTAITASADAGLAAAAGNRQRKRAGAGSILTGPRNTPGGTPAAVTMPRQLLGSGGAPAPMSERRA